MCIAVYTLDGRRLGTAGDLMDAGLYVHPMHVIWPELPSPDGVNDFAVCLCGTDVNSIVEDNDIAYIEDSDTGDLILTEGIPT